MNILEKIDLFINESDELNEGRKPFFKTNSPEIILKHVMDKMGGDKKKAYTYLNGIRRKSMALDDNELTHRLSAALKLLGTDVKTNKRGQNTNTIVAAKEVHRNIKKVLGYVPTKKSGDYTEAEKKRIEQYIRNRYPNINHETFYDTLNSLK